MTSKPFRIAVPEEHLQLLRKKLELVTFPDELDEAGWDYGTNLSELRGLVEYWQHGFDWRAQEARINTTLSQFTMDIDVDGFGTLNIHFIHQRSPVKGAVPLLFVHGWPGNFTEVSKLLPLLTTPDEGQPSFHVVAIGLPGFGFSQGPRERGFDLSQYAEVCHKLMSSLNYPRYGMEETGAFKTIGRMYGGKYCMGSHINMPLGLKPRFFSNPFLWLHHAVTSYSPKDKAEMRRAERFHSLGTGYQAIQGTKPQTLGYALADSPVGLLAWIYEKLRDWSDDYPWTKDEILTWVSIYLFSRDGPAASLRIYYESTQQNHVDLALHPVKNLPLGISFFPKELFHQPRDYPRTLGNVVFESTHESGGHFAAHEKPELLAKDLWVMFGRNGPAFGVVPGHSGYEESKGQNGDMN